MKNSILSLLFLLFLQTISSQTLTLFDCWEMSRNHYPMLKGKEVLAKSTDLNIKNIKSKWFPQLDLVGQASWQSDVPNVDMGSTVPGLSVPQAPKDQYKIILDVNQTIYDGGRIEARSQIQDIAGSVEEQNIEIQLYEVKNRVTDLFFKSLILKEQEELFSHKLELLSSRIQEITSAFKNGVVKKSEVNTLEAEYLLASQEHSSILHSLNVLLDNLSSYIGRDISSVSFLHPPLANDFLNPQQRPEYRLFDLQQQQLNERSTLTKKDRWPVLAAFAQAGYGNPGYNMLKDEFDTFMMLGLRLKWTPWDWKESKRKTMVLQNQTILVEMQLETFSVNQSRAVSRFEGEISQYLKMMEFDDQIVRLREDIVVQSEKRLKNGTITSTDYMADLNADIHAKINRKMHRLRFLQNMALKFIAGKSVND